MCLKKNSLRKYNHIRIKTARCFIWLLYDKLSAPIENAHQLNCTAPMPIHIKLEPNNKIQNSKSFFSCGFRAVTFLEQGWLSIKKKRHRLRIPAAVTTYRERYWTSAKLKRKKRMIDLVWNSDVKKLLITGKQTSTSVLTYWLRVIPAH